MTILRHNVDFCNFFADCYLVVLTLLFPNGLHGLASNNAVSGKKDNALVAHQNFFEQSWNMGSPKSAVVISLKSHGQLDI